MDKIKFSLKIFIITVFFISSSILCNIYTKSYYEKTYIASYTDKLDSLKNTKGEKIILVGGSSVALGLNAEYFSSLINKPTVNMGLYAMKSYDIYLATIEPYVNKSDTVILQLEYGAFENDYWDYNDVGLDIANLTPQYEESLSMQHKLIYYPKQFLRSFGRLFETVIFSNGPIKEKIYLRSNVNNYGDFTAHKDLASSYNGNSHLNITINDSSIKSILEYVKKYENKGATVYINFQPYCVSDSSSEVEQQSTYIYEKLFSYFGDRILERPIDNIYYDKSYFFDTDSHLSYKESLNFTKRTFHYISSK